MMTRIIFACIENACRSQMAEGFARYLGGEEFQVSSGGSKPADKINEKAVRVMREKGIDISSQKPISIGSEESKKSDYVVTMGCGPEACPAPISGKTIEWDIEDPAGKSIEKFREVRNEIEKKVRRLLNRISVE